MVGVSIGRIVQKEKNEKGFWFWGRYLGKNVGDYRYERIYIMLFCFGLVGFLSSFVIYCMDVGVIIICC